MKTYAVVYLVAAGLALVVTPLVARLARALKLLDYPGVRKVHAVPVPRIGGVAIFVATLGAVVPVLALDNLVGEAFWLVHRRMAALLAGGVFMLAVGVWDDVRGLKPHLKLVAQIAAALLVCACGIRITHIGLGPWAVVHFGWWSWPITILWIVGVTNAVNLIDGLDGLAAGISAITCGVIVVLAAYANQPVMAVVALALLGSLTGFLFFNFNPARVFLGDSGTLFVGFTIGAASVMRASKSTALVGLALPALALGVPLFDTALSILRRVIDRRSPFASDRSHLHHRLLERGLGQRRAVLLMYGVTFLAAALGMFMLVARDVGALLIFACVAVLVITILRGVGALSPGELLASLRRRRALSQSAREAREDFERAKLWLNGSEDFAEWWSEVCAAAEELACEGLVVTLPPRHGDAQTLVWRRDGALLERDGVVRLAFQVPDRRRGRPLELEVLVRVNGSFESAASRAALFARLIHEHGPAGRLGKTGAAAEPKARTGVPGEHEALRP
jgi:UDP-GlcNAc:undecaprenyl-phosphate GlcNAc-1-phosphate transferase